MSGKVLEKINAWRAEEWDGTLHCHMEWCVRGATLHRELSEFKLKGEET